MQEVDSLINKDSDLFAALKLLHPNLHDGIISFTKKLQRKVETLELKQLP